MNDTMTLKQLGKAMRQAVAQVTSRDAVLHAGTTLSAEPTPKTLSLGRTWEGGETPLDDNARSEILAGFRAGTLSAEQRAAIEALIEASGSPGWKANGAGIATKVSDHLGHIDPEVASTMRTVADINRRNSEFWKQPA